MKKKLLITILSIIATLCCALSFAGCGIFSGSGSTDGKASKGLIFTLNTQGTAYFVTGIGTCTDNDIRIPNTYNNLPITTIGKAAFQQCDNITSVIIPDSIKYINERAFALCYGLKTINLPNSIITIGDSVFADCIALKSVNIPQSVTYFGNYVYNGCSSLESITVDKYNSQYHSSGNCLIETTSRKLIQGCKKSIIPNDGSVTSISDTAFHSCTSLSEIVIPDSVISIGSQAFNLCSSLTSLTIGKNVASIGNYAFLGCTSLTNATFKNTQNWKITKNNSTSNLSSDDLANSTIAAKYLTSTYSSYIWTNGED